MKTNTKLLQYENAKLKQQLTFGLPATVKVCGRECPGCYAIKAQKLYPKTVMPYRERMYSASLSPTFVTTVIKEIKEALAKGVKVLAVRLHTSGEFYSQAYINKWVRIAKELPDVKFYTFTKRMKDFNFTHLKALPNFVLIDSLKYGVINYATATELLQLSLSKKLETATQRPKLCPATVDSTVKCGPDCGYCWSKLAQKSSVIFLKH